MSKIRILFEFWMVDFVQYSNFQVRHTALLKEYIAISYVMYTCIILLRFKIHDMQFVNYYITTSCHLDISISAYFVVRKIAQLMQILVFTHNGAHKAE